MHSFIHTYRQTDKQTNTRTYIHSFNHSYMHSFIHLFIHSSIHSFMHSSIHSYGGFVRFSFFPLPLPRLSFHGVTKLGPKFSFWCTPPVFRLTFWALLQIWPTPLSLFPPWEFLRPLCLPGRRGNWRQLPSGDGLANLELSSRSRIV